MSNLLYLIVFVFLSSNSINSQYPEDSNLYNESIGAGEEILRASIESNPDVNFIIHPERRMIDINEYVFIQPEIEDYVIGISIDPVR